MALTLMSSPLLAQLQSVRVDGRVLGPADEPIGAARVVVLDRLGAVVASARSDSDGRFAFARLSSDVACHES